MIKSTGNDTADGTIAAEAIRRISELFHLEKAKREKQCQLILKSAILYSLVETAKANDLRVYEYLEYLFSELAKHADDTKRDFLKDLLPWSEVVQEKCHSLKIT